MLNRQPLLEINATLRKTVSLRLDCGRMFPVYITLLKKRITKLVGLLAYWHQSIHQLF